MTDITAHDIHRLDQAYPDALADIEAHIGDPQQKAALADKGTEVYAAELTRDLAHSATSPMSLAAWAAVATVRLMQAGKAWEDDTDAAWAKVAELTEQVALLRAELAKGRDAVVAMTQTALDHRTTASNALNRATRLYEQLAASQNALRSLGQAYADLKTDNDELAAENARVRQQRDEALAALDADDEPSHPDLGGARHHAPNGCDDCSVEPGDWHRYPECPGNLRAIERAKAAVTA